MQSPYNYYLLQLSGKWFGLKIKMRWEKRLKGREQLIERVCDEALLALHAQKNTSGDPGTWFVSSHILKEVKQSKDEY